MARILPAGKSPRRRKGRVPGPLESRAKGKVGLATAKGPNGAIRVPGPVTTGKREVAPAVRPGSPRLPAGAPRRKRGRPRYL